MNKRRVFLTVITILIVFCLIISISYAIYIIAPTNRYNINSNAIIPDCVGIQLLNNSEVRLSADLSAPVSDNKALNKDNYRFQFTLKNNCDSMANLKVALAPTINSTFQTSAIKYAIYESDGQKPSSGTKLSLNEKLLSKNIVDELKELTGDDVEVGYEVLNTVMNPKTSYTYYMYVWVDEAEGGLGNNITMNRIFNAHLIISDYNSIGNSTETSVLLSNHIMSLANHPDENNKHSEYLIKDNSYYSAPGAIPAYDKNSQYSSNYYTDIQYGTDYSFKPMKEGSNIWINDNHSIGRTTSEISISLKPGTYDFCYLISSEASCDYGYMYKNSKTEPTLNKLSGTSQTEFICTSLGTLTGDDYIYVKYYKDGALSEGLDSFLFYIKDSNENVTTTYTENIEYSDSVIAVDHEKNYRYIGSNPNNYLWFNDELWRIIGSFEESYMDEQGNIFTGDLVKIIKADSIGSIPWDYKQNNVGSSTSSNGSNDWSDSQLMMMLNPSAYLNTGYISPGLTSHLYYINDDYVKANNVNIFRNMGSYFDSSKQMYIPSSTSLSGFNSSNTINVKRISGESQNYIATAKWHLGGATYNSSNYTNIPAWFVYERERSTNVSNSRPTYWFGKIGLMYPSDYLYALDGANANEDHYFCINNEYGSSTFIDNCGKNWLNFGDQWLISPYTSSNYQSFYLNDKPNVYSAYINKNVYPVLYLKPNYALKSGNGTWSTPYNFSSIDFTVNNKEFSILERLTWETFMSSAYNVDNYTINGNKVMYNQTTQIEGIIPTDLILPNGSYNLVNITFNVDGNSYTITEHMTWQEFINSNYNTQNWYIENGNIMLTSSKQLLGASATDSIISTTYTVSEVSSVTITSASVTHDNYSVSISNVVLSDSSTPTAMYISFDGTTYHECSIGYCSAYEWTPGCNNSSTTYYMYAVLSGGGRTRDYIGTTSYSCFVPGTRILSEHGYKNIEDIKVGDKVYSYNEITRQVELRNVTKTYDHVDNRIYEIKVGNEIIKVTPDHRIYTKGKYDHEYKWTKVYNIHEGDFLITSSGKETRVDSIKYHLSNTQMHVYNFEVEGNHTYFVSYNNYIVHNAKEPCGKI